jgi:hypothetical protein
MIPALLRSSVWGGNLELEVMVVRLAVSPEGHSGTLADLARSGCPPAAA